MRMGDCSNSSIIGIGIQDPGASHVVVPTKDIQMMYSTGETQYPAPPRWYLLE